MSVMFSGPYLSPRWVQEGEKDKYFFERAQKLMLAEIAAIYGDNYIVVSEAVGENLTAVVYHGRSLKQKDILNYEDAAYQAILKFRTKAVVALVNNESVPQDNNRYPWYRYAYSSEKTNERKSNAIIKAFLGPYDWKSLEEVSCFDYSANHVPKSVADYRNEPLFMDVSKIDLLKDLQMFPRENDKLRNWQLKILGLDLHYDGPKSTEPAMRVFW